MVQNVGLYIIHMYNAVLCAVWHYNVVWTCVEGAGLEMIWGRKQNVDTPLCIDVQCVWAMMIND